MRGFIPFYFNLEKLTKFMPVFRMNKHVPAENVHTKFCQGFIYLNVKQNK